MLLEVIRVVRCHPDFDNGGPMAEMMDQALAGVEHPDALVAIVNLSQGLKPPVTSRPEARQHEAWIVTSDTGKVLHFSRADGWELEIVQPHMNCGGT